jgi:hypothetical protein
MAIRMSGAGLPRAPSLVWPNGYFTGSVNATAFLTYVERALVPVSRPGDVVVFDNLSSHPGPAVFGAIERAGASASAAALRPGLRADRGDVLEVQGVPAPGRCPGQGAPV